MGESWSCKYWHCCQKKCSSNHGFAQTLLKVPLNAYSFCIYKATHDYLQHSQFAGLDLDITVLCSLEATEQLLITKRSTAKLLQTEQVPVTRTLTMLCLRILCTTGVNTSITTMDRGRSRQCCNEQQVICWAAEITKMGHLQLHTPRMDYPMVNKIQGLN